MADLFWPGSERAAGVFDDAALLTAMVRAEQAWLDALATAGVVPASTDLTGLVDETDLAAVSAGAESGGNPVIPLVALLRARVSPEVAAGVHRGLTSQDVLDTALMLCSRDTVARIAEEVDHLAALLAHLAHLHRGTVMAGRTLTQHAVPITFGLKAAQWLAGVLDARDALVRLEAPAQFGGAAGTMAATVEAARLAGAADPVRTARTVANDAAARLGLLPALPWQTRRAPVTRTGDALVATTDSLGRIANDVLVLSRPEVGELREGVGGGSSTMPHKANPVLSVLVRRAALAAPGLGAQLHLAAAESVDERADGGWHLEWSTLATLARRTLVAASQSTELLAGLQVDVDRMAFTAASATADLLAEQRSLGGDGDDLASYLGINDPLVEAVLDRYRKAHP